MLFDKVLILLKACQETSTKTDELESKETTSTKKDDDFQVKLPVAAKNKLESDDDCVFVDDKSTNKAKKSKKPTKPEKTAESPVKINPNKKAKKDEHSAETKPKEVEKKNVDCEEQDQSESSQHDVNK